VQLNMYKSRNARPRFDERIRNRHRYSNTELFATIATTAASRFDGREREREGLITRLIDAICECSPADLRYWNSSEEEMSARIRMRHQVQYIQHNGRTLGRWHSFLRHIRHRRTRNNTDRQTDRRWTDRQTDRRTD